MSYNYAGKSLKGAGRKRNEDRWLTRQIGEADLLLAVADGMGGAPGGDIAAQMIIDAFEQYRPQTGRNQSRQIKEVLLGIDASIAKVVEHQPEMRGMGATATVAHIWGERLSWVNLGDSRLYLLRGPHLTPVTRDDTYVQHLVDQGKLTDQEAASHPLGHVLEQAVGAIDSEIDSGSFTVKRGDRIFLCTDGVYKACPEKRLISLFNSPHSPSEQVASLLQIVSRTVKHDDATVIVVHVT